MSWKPGDEFVVTHASAPFYGGHGTVDEINRPFPYPIKGTVGTPDGDKPCWWRLDEIEHRDVDAPTEQIEAVTG